MRVVITIVLLLFKALWISCGSAPLGWASLGGSADTGWLAWLI